MMLKKLIAPLQRVLLSRKYCPACTRNLDDIKDRQIRNNGTERVTCVCGRIFIYDRKLDKYRRALKDEV